MLVEGGIEVLFDAVHAPGADGFDPRGFQRLEDLARELGLWRLAGVDLGVVVAELQRNRISLAACQRHVGRRQMAAG